MIFFKTREVFTTTELPLFTKVIDALSQHRIPFRSKTTVIGPSNRGRGLFGTAGESTDHKTIYYVYTRKKDADKASKVIRDTVFH